MTTKYVNLHNGTIVITAKLHYNKMAKRRRMDYPTKYDWCLNHHTAVIERFSGGITTSMVCGAMRKKGFGYEWQTADRLQRNGIHSLKKAKQISDMLFEEFGVFVPYMELLGFRDVVTDNIESEI